MLAWPMPDPLDRAGSKSVSERRCLVTRKTAERTQLVRFVVDPRGVVVPDVDGRLPGRGMWLSADRDVVKKATVKNLFARAARSSVRIETDLAEEVERLLVRRILDRLGLARRAGQVAAGFEQVRERLGAQAVALVLHARDGAADGRRKLDRFAIDLPRLVAFTGAELGGALGRDCVVHVAVAPGKLADSLLVDGSRLAGFRTDVMLSPERVPGTVAGPQSMMRAE